MTCRKKVFSVSFYQLKNSEIELSLPWKLISTIDNNLLMSNGIHYFDKLGRYSQLIKLDTLGNIIWNVEGEDRFSNGAASALVVELSNGNIVQVYKIDKSQDLEFLNMGFGWSVSYTHLTLPTILLV